MTETLTIEEYQRRIGRKQKKFGNRWALSNDGKLFQSGAERDRYEILQVLVSQGHICDLILQPKFELIPKFERAGEAIRRVTYAADFAYTENGTRIVEDVKGHETQLFKMKWKLVQFQNPDLTFRIVPA
jgi:hypothetical protein